MSNIQYSTSINNNRIKQVRGYKVKRNEQTQTQAMCYRGMLNLDFDDNICDADALELYLKS